MKALKLDDSDFNIVILSLYRVSRTEHKIAIFFLENGGLSSDVALPPIVFEEEEEHLSPEEAQMVSFWDAN